MEIHGLASMAESLADPGADSIRQLGSGRLCGLDREMLALRRGHASCRSTSETWGPRIFGRFSRGRLCARSSPALWGLGIELQRRAAAEGHSLVSSCGGEIMTTSPPKDLPRCSNRWRRIGRWIATSVVVIAALAIFAARQTAARHEDLTPESPVRA